jgi:elongator complex protein 3
LGRRLMEKAEKIAKKRGYKAISVISGIGVRPYYRRLGYRLKNTYMAKALK